MAAYDKIVKTTASVVALLAACAGLFGIANTTFAQKADVRKQIGKLEEQFLYSERRNLQRERYSYEIQVEKGKRLTDKEMEHYKSILDEIKRIDMELKSYQKSR